MCDIAWNIGRDGVVTRSKSNLNYKILHSSGKKMAERTLDLEPVEVKYKSFVGSKNKNKKRVKVTVDKEESREVDMSDHYESDTELDLDSDDNKASKNEDDDESADKLIEESRKELEELKRKSRSLEEGNKKLMEAARIKRMIDEEKERCRILEMDRKGNDISTTPKRKSKVRRVLSTPVKKSKSNSNRNNNNNRKIRNNNDLQILLGLLQQQGEAGAVASSAVSKSSSEETVDSSPEKKKKKGKKAIESGMVEKSTSFENVRKVKWANVVAGSESGSKEIPFESVKFAELVFGELEIIDRPKISREQSRTRLYVLKRVAKNVDKLGFDRAKEIYRKTLSKVERGQLGWGEIEKIREIEADVKFDFMAIGDKKRFDNKEKNLDMPDKVYCFEYNSGICKEKDHHEGKFRDKVVKKWHMCKVCYTKNKVVKAHKAGDSVCPFKKNE
jgi:hypothetical protein